MTEKEKNVVLNFKMDGQVQYAKTIKDINAIMNAAASEYQTHVAAMGKDAQATSKLSAEKKKLEIQMNAAKERTKMLRAEYEAMAKDTKTSTAQLANKYKQLQNSERAEIALGNALDKVNEGLSDQAEESRKAQQALDKLESEASQLETQTEKLNAEYELQVAQLGDTAKESDKLKLKMEQLNATHELAGEKVSNYEEQLEQAKKQYGENSTEVDKYEIQLTEARTAEQQLANEIVSANKELQKQNDVLANTSKKLKETGDKMKDVGKNLSMKVTAPLVGVAAAATKVGMDFEASVSEMGATSGAVGEDLLELENKAREMGATTNKSAKEAADAMGYMALAGWDNRQMLEGIEPVLKLSSAGNIDLARTSDLVTDSMAAMQLEVEGLPDFLDMVAQASRKSNTDIDALMEAFLVAGGTMSTFNVPLEESTALLGIMANRGYKGAEAGTALNAIFTNLTRGTGEAQKALDKYGISVFDAEGEFKGLETVLMDIKDKTADMTDEQKANFISLVAGKEHLKTFNAMLSGLGDEYGALKEDVSNANGVLEEMYDVMTDNLKGAFDEFKSGLAESGITIFKNLQPALESLLGYLQQGVNWFNNLSPAMQNTIVVIAGVVAAVGPLLVGAGILVSSLGAIFTAVGTVSGAIAVVTTGVAAATPAVGGLAAVFTLLTGPVGLIIAGLVAVGVGAVALGKHLSKDAIPEVERFGEGVSDATKEALEGFFELSDGVSQSLSEISITSSKVTDEMKEDIVGKYAEMNAQILEGKEKGHAEEIAQMESMFLNTSVLTDQEIEDILNKKQEGYDKEVERLEYNNEVINEIMQLAADEKRELTEREKDVINNINKHAQEEAVRVLSESEMEQKIILEKMADSAADLSARQAAEVVANSAKQREESVAEAESQYDETYAAILRMRDETGELTEEQATKLIAEAKKQRDESVKYAESMHEDVVKEAKKQATEHVDEVNWETGEILSKWEVFKNNTSTKFKEIAKGIKDGWDDGVTATKERVESIKKAASDKFTETATTVLTKMTEVKTNIKNKWNEAQKFLEDVDLKQIGMDIIMGLVGGINDKMKAVAKAITGITNKIKSVFKKEMDTASPSKVMIKGGEDVGEGVAIGVESKESRVGQAMTVLGDKMKSITKQFTKETNQIHKNANAEIAKIEKRSAEDIAKIQRTASAKKRKTTQDENIRIRRIQEDAAKKIASIENKAAADSVNLLSKTQKEKLQEIKLFVDDKKSMEQLSLVDEAKIWEESVKFFKDGTKEKVEAQKSYKSSVEAVNKEIVSINKEFSGEMDKINNELIKQIDDLNKAYDDSVNKRKQSLESFKGIFDSFEWGGGPSGQELMQNLQTQLDGFELWQKEIDKISSKAIDEGLIAELREMGPKALPELLALNQLTDEELTKYSDMYGDKMRMAREQAEAEHVEMKINTEKQISELRKAANKKLDHLQSDWTKAIRKITQTTSDEFKSLDSIGKQAGHNLLNGLASMEGALVAKARSIAAAVNAAMEGALGGGTPSLNTMSFDTQWNAKGGIFTQPTIFGASGGKLQGAGEAGPEAVLPLNDETLGSIGKAIAKTMGRSPITINSRDDAESIARAVERAQRRQAFKI